MPDSTNANGNIPDPEYVGSAICCLHCNRFTSNELDTYRQHLKSDHDSMTEYRCGARQRDNQVCGHILYTLGGLMKHIKKCLKVNSDIIASNSEKVSSLSMNYSISTEYYE